MASENHPISSLIKKIISDPASTKLLTILYSVVLIVATCERTRKQWHIIPLLVIYGSSLIYSILALFVVVFNNENDIEKSACLKKIFGGRKVYWHEIQTTATWMLAFAQFSAITLAFAGEINRPETHMIFSFLNCFFFTLEFYRASKIAEAFVLEENLNTNGSCLACILRPFNCCPTFFNLVRKTCFIVSAILIAKSRLLSYMNVYYFHCIAFAIVASFLLFGSQICQAFKKRNSSSPSSCGRKWQTYLLLIIAMHAFLAVLTLSLITGLKTDVILYPTYVDRSHHSNTQLSNHGTDQSNHSINKSSNEPTTTPNALKTEWYNRFSYHPWYYAPTEVPIPFSLTCIGLVLAFLDLYSRAIRSQSNQKISDTYSNNITIPSNPDITTPLHIHDGITKIEDLPIVVAAPHHFTEPLKVVFTILHFCAIFVVINGIVWHNVFLPIAIIGFPLGIFGLFSTLFCFQQKYNEQFDQNYRNISKPKCAQILLKFCVNDFVKCIILFNVAIIVFFGILACQYRYHQGSDFVIALLNLPIIIPVIILLAILFKSKKLCYGGFFGYGLLVGIAIGFFSFLIFQIYNNALQDGFEIIQLFGIFLIFCTGFIYSFIGINTTLFLYRKYGNQNESEIKRAPNVIYKTSFYLWQSSKSFMS